MSTDDLKCPFCGGRICVTEWDHGCDWECMGKGCGAIGPTKPTHDAAANHCQETYAKLNPPNEMSLREVLEEARQGVAAFPDWAKEPDQPIVNILQSVYARHQKRDIATAYQREVDFTKAQLIEVRHLKELAGDHPVMSISFAQREKELETKLADLEAADPDNNPSLREWLDAPLKEIGG